MITPKTLEEALNLITKALTGINNTQLQHNKMLLDLYERVAKLEEKNDSSPSTNSK